MMSQWANILIYFEMPSWIKDWDSVVEEEDDLDDVKALKVGKWSPGIRVDVIQCLSIVGILNNLFAIRCSFCPRNF